MLSLVICCTFFDIKWKEKAKTNKISYPTWLHLFLMERNIGLIFTKAFLCGRWRTRPPGDFTESQNCGRQKEGRRPAPLPLNQMFRAAYSFTHVFGCATRSGILHPPPQEALPVATVTGLLEAGMELGEGECKCRCGFLGQMRTFQMEQTKTKSRDELRSDGWCSCGALVEDGKNSKRRDRAGDE